MTRISKKAQRRAISPRKYKRFGIKMNSRKNSPSQGYKHHENGIEGNSFVFIGKIK